MGGRNSHADGWADAPPIFFSVLPEKETGRARSKRKGRLTRSGAVALRAHGGRRIGASADLGLPSGTLGSSARSILPSRGGECRRRRGARTYLTSSSFRAFRFATRCPGGRRGCCVGPCCSSHQPPASGSENRRRMYPRPPRAKDFPKGRAFPSLTAARDRQPSPAGGRRSARAQTDPPNIFSFPPGAAHFLFDVSKRKWGAHLPSHQHGCCPHPDGWNDPRLPNACGIFQERRCEP